ncbi:zinc finger MYM-type protein 1-like [Saccostrea echinata]|uniref:zinc finger MYM-type protein 1-like n=1 Tax=Saccostrea echinata TaxID=191078 RepID=UPI002A82CD1E|nr:zinc finger MYM-type protein 1-like [Saccostrea echinata]
MSIFPEVQNPGVNRKDHNQLIVPLDRADAKENQDAIHIMWTHTIATKIDGWTPNHFVACIHKYKEPLSKRSRLFFEDSEPHRSFEPKQSQNSPSPFFESNTNEESIETGKLGETAKKETDKHVEVASFFDSSSSEDDMSEIPVQKAQVVHEKWHTPEIGSTPNQPRNIFFPAKRFGKKMRSFNASWFDRWSWLHYVVNKDVVFCFSCIKSFQKKTLSCHKKEKACISRGFKNWKKATTKFAEHEKSDCHKEAMEREFTIKKEVKDVGESLSKTHEVEKKSNRENLLKITNILKFLARQGIALRGDKDEKNSNFNQLLMLEAKRDPQLQEWLQRKTNKYVAPDIQNEILQVMGLQVLRQIVAFIKSSEFFSIMADETRDISNKEQLVLCIRWVDQNFTAHEDLLGMYCLPDIGANSITLAIKDALLKFDLPISKVRGQCYDMAGSKTGVATQIHALEPRALYIHCYGHALNLACSYSIKACKLLRDTLDIAKDITKLIKESPRREMIFNTLKNAQNLEKTSAGIRVLCPTRWTIKADTFLSIFSNYEILRNVWDECLQYVREVEMRNRILGEWLLICAGLISSLGVY